MFLKQKKKKKKKELNPILTEIGFLVNYISCLILNTYLSFGQETHPQVPFGCLL